MAQNNNIQWYPGHMGKAINELYDKIQYMDFVMILLDSRIPLSSKNDLLERMACGKNRLYILTKKDLSDPLETEKWIKYFTGKGSCAIAVNLKETGLVNYLNEYTHKFVLKKETNSKRKKIIFTRCRAMVLGIPNVGKSTLINVLSQKKVVLTADKVGMTRNVNMIHTKNFDLVDTPGMLEPSYENKEKAFNLALIGAMNTDVLPVEELCKKCVDFLLKNYHLNFISRFNLLEKECTDFYTVIQAIGRERGFLSKHDEVDMDKTERVILNEFRSGNICNFTLERVEDALPR